MKKLVVFGLAVYEFIITANAWAYGDTPPGGGSAPEIPAGSGPYVLAAVVGVVFLARYLTRKK